MDKWEEDMLRFLISTSSVRNYFCFGHFRSRQTRNKKREAIVSRENAVKEIILWGSSTKFGG